MVQKDGSIVISEWQEGVAESPMLGAESIIACDIFDEPGLIKIKSAPSLQTNDLNDGGTSGFVVGQAVNDNGYRVSISENGMLEVLDDTGLSAISTTALTRGWDVVVISSGFTLYSYSSGGVGHIGAVRFRTGSFDRFNAVITGLTGTNAIKFLTAQDGYTYYTNGNSIGRITALTDNGSGTPPTLTYSSNVLNLPANVYATTMAELGSNLLIGTQRNTAFSSKGQYNFANVYPWDRTSSSFRLPVQVQESGINAMVQKDNLVYLSAGVKGNIYVTDGTTYRKIKTLPFAKTKKYGATSQVYYNAMAISQEGNLLVGTSTYSDTSSTSPRRHGVWEVNLSASGYPTTLSYVARNGELGVNYPVYVGYVGTSGTETIVYSTSINSVYEIVQTSSTKYTDYIATYETEVFFVGTKQGRKSYQSLEFTLSEPLLSTQGVKISYRKDLTADYTEIGTWDFSTLGSVISHYGKALIADAEMVQIKIQLTQASSVPFPGNVKLLRVMLK